MNLRSLRPLLDDPGPFASAYADVSRTEFSDEAAAELRAREAADRLSDRGAPESVVEAIRDRLSEASGHSGSVGRCVVASERGEVLLDELIERTPAHTSADWSALPDLGGWLRDQTLMVPFILARVDHEGGDVTVFSDRQDAERVADIRTRSPWEHRVSSGGWSELHRQRSTENEWRRRADEVAGQIRAAVDDTGYDLVVLIGDVQSRQDVVAQLDNLRAEICQLEHGGRQSDGGDAALESAVRDILRSRVVADRLAVIHELRERLGQGHGAATGIRDVAEAFVRGQVDRLLIDPEVAAERVLDPADVPGLVFGAVEPTGSLRADQALIAAAILTDADVLPTPASTLGDTPAAALLRWSQPAESSTP